MKRLLFAVLLILVSIVGCDLNFPFTVRLKPPVQENQPPVAYIDSISPTEATPGQMVSFNGHGTDRDGEVVGYLWRSNLDGDLSSSASFQTSSLSAGSHTISLKVKDDFENWSTEVSSRITVSVGSEPPPPPPPPLVTTPPTIEVFEANPGLISEGETSTLSWVVKNANFVDISPDIVAFPCEGSACDGYAYVTPSVSTTYTLTAHNEFSRTSATVHVAVGLVPAISEFEVTRVTLTSTPSGTYSCPHAITWHAGIFVNREGTVTYEWELGGESYSGYRTIDFERAGGKSITFDSTVRFPGTYWVRLRVSSPNEIWSNPASVDVLCEPDFWIVDVVPLSSEKINISSAGPCVWRIEFRSAITVSGPGTVTYHWEQSDGAVGPTQSLTFPRASSQIVTHTWTVRNPGSYAAWVRPLSPDVSFSIRKKQEHIECSEMSRGGSLPIGR